MNKKVLIIPIIIAVLAIAFISIKQSRNPGMPVQNAGTSCEAEHALPPGLSKEYEEGYIKMCHWLDKEIGELKPTQYKPMMFTGFHLPVSYELYPYTNSADDIKFLDVLTDLDVGVVGVGVRAPESHTQADLERLDALFNEVHKRGKKLKIWYFGGAYDDKQAYIDKGEQATKDIIERWHPDIFTIVHELATQEKAYRFDMSSAEWQAYISNLRTTYARRPALQKAIANL